MAYYRRKYRGRKYYFKRARASRSTRAISTSRAFKSSAANMTQNGKFNISTKFTQTINIASGTASAFQKLDIPNFLVQSDMHKALSNVFDQYRVEKATLKFNLLLNSASMSTDVGHLTFFTACDRTGFAANATVASIRTYGSYKETTWSLNGDSNAPHYVSVGQADLVSKSEYYDSKNRATFPTIVAGLDLGAAVTANKAITITCEIDAQVRYRGVRLDTTGRSIQISTLNLYTATTSATVNDQFLKVTADGSFTLASGKSFFSFRKWTLTLDNETFDGYRLWLVTNPTSSSVTLSISATTDNPCYYVTYNDEALHFNTCVGLLDQEDFLITVYGGQGGTGANARHETWLFCPSSEFDFSPLINDIERRLNP